MPRFIQALLSFLAASVTFAMGGWSSLLGSLIAIVILDYLTGVLAAAANGKLNSTIGVKGIARKLLIFILVSVAHLLDGVMKTGSMIRDTIIYFYISNEVISILENSIELGLPIPQILIKLCNNLGISKIHKDQNKKEE